MFDAYKKETRGGGGVGSVLRIFEDNLLNEHPCKGGRESAGSVTSDKWGSTDQLDYES